MIRPLGLVVGLVGLALAIGLAALAAQGRADRGPVYTVAQVGAHLHRDPAARVGRTLWVRGRIAGCPGILSPAARSMCHDWDRWELADTTAPATEPLLMPGDPDPLLAALRRMPLPSGLLPAPQALHWWGAAATYRVQIRPVPAARCYRMLPCYEALLLDAAPDSL